MHSIDQQQLQRRSNSIQTPLIYSTSLSSVSLFQDPSLTFCYNSISTKYHQGENENRRNLGLYVTHRQQQHTITDFRYHPYAFRQPTSQQRSFRSTQQFPPNPIALMGDDN